MVVGLKNPPADAGDRRDEGFVLFFFFSLSKSSAE